MLPSYLLSLREGIEAALIIGIVLGALRKMHRRTDFVPALWLGAISRCRRIEHSCRRYYLLASG